jgi:lysophospholipase L1-like esterase
MTGRRLALAVVAALALTAPAAAGETCDPLAIELSTTPQRTPNYPNLIETVDLMATPVDRADAVLLGDSLFAGWHTDLARAFPATAVYDFAIGGDRVPYVLWRIDHGNLAALRPRLAALLIGTNDLASGTPPCGVVAGIEAIVGRLGTIWPKTPVLVLTVPPRGRDFRDIDDRRKALNAAIAGLPARHPDVHVVPIDDEAFTCGLYGKAAEALPPAARTADGRLICANYADDNLHFSTEGYVALGRIVSEASRAVLGADGLR